MGLEMVLADGVSHIPSAGHYTTVTTVYNIDHSYSSRAFGNLKLQSVLSLRLVHIRAISPFQGNTPC